MFTQLVLAVLSIFFLIRFLVTVTRKKASPQLKFPSPHRVFLP